MAFQNAKDRAIPEVTVVAQYEIQRINDPHVRVIYNEAVRAFETSVAVTAGAQGDELVVPAWADRTDLIGKEVQTPKGESLGTVLAWDNGTTTVTLSATVSPVPAEVQVEQFNAFGSVVHRPAASGRSWTIKLTSTDPVALAYMQNMLATAHLNAVRAVLDELGDTTISDAQILGALQSLGQQGLNLDSFITAVCEQVELDRIAGDLGFGIVEGEAPYNSGV